MQNKKPAADDESAPEVDFDETMRRLMAIPRDRAKEVVQKSAPGKSKAVRQKKRTRKRR